MNWTLFWAILAFGMLALSLCMVVELRRSTRLQDEYRGAWQEELQLRRRLMYGEHAPSPSVTSGLPKETQ